MPEKPKIRSIQNASSPTCLKVEQVELQFSNGEQRVFERIRHPSGQSIDIVMAIPLLDSETLLLIREYGVGVEDYYLGFPKGCIDPEEQPAQAMQRELKEEIKYGAGVMTPLLTLASSPAFLGSFMTVFVAEELYPAALTGDEPEPLEVIPWNIAEVDRLLAHPEFIDARSIAALLLFLRQRGQ